MSYTSSIPLIKILGITLFALSAIGYAVYQTEDFIRGPVVDFIVPADGETVQEPILSISGTAHKVSFISLNGRPIFTDIDGKWTERVVLHAGYNILTVVARDRFGRETATVKRVVLAEAPAPPPLPFPPASTSTEQTDTPSPITKPLL